MDVVLDLQEIVSAWVGAGDSIIPDVFAVLDIDGIIIQVSLSIQVEIYNMITKGSQLRPASVGRADRIRGST